MEITTINTDNASGIEMIPSVRCFRERPGGRLSENEKLKRVNSSSLGKHFSILIAKAIELGFKVYSGSSRGSYVFFAPKGEIDLASVEVMTFLRDNMLNLIPFGARPGDCIGDMASGINPSYLRLTKNNITTFRIKDAVTLKMLKKAIGIGFTPYITNSGNFLFHFQDGFEETDEVAEFIENTKTIHPN